jgi:hypothetical protein
MQLFLKKHGPGPAYHSVKVDYQLQGNDLSMNFSVQKRTGDAWASDSGFTSDWKKNWGLWNKDVVEVFLQLRNHSDEVNAPYLELQVSPLNQPFALIITEPRKVFFPPEKLEMTHQTDLKDRLWNTQLNVKLPNELRGQMVYGGFFSCLEATPREYYALFPNSEEKPDFHRPDLFVCLN